MPRKVYFNLLLFCVVLSQGIATSEENIDLEKSSDLQIRKKRVIIDTPDAKKSVPITMFPFLVNIKKYRKSVCSGSIVSPHVVLTIAHCLEDNLRIYHVYSGSEKTTGSGGKYHNVMSKSNHPLYRSNQFDNALTLITIEPEVHRAYTEIIQLQAGPSIPGVHGTVAGWGCNQTTPNGRLYPDRLQAITVTVISNQECQNAYRNHNALPFPIKESELCVLHNSGRCSHGDTGAPLVIFRRLAGLFIWSADEVGKPDIFVNLEHPDTHLWVSSNIQNIESHLHNNRFHYNPNNPHHLPFPLVPFNLPANHLK